MKLKDMMKLAADKRLTSFDPMKPCKRGHTSLRTTSSGQCLACRSESRKNSEKHREINRLNSAKFTSENRTAKNKMSRESYHKRKSEGKVKKYNKQSLFIRMQITRLIYNWKGSSRKAEQIVGYSKQQLKEHIESLFTDGMSWENYGEWHIDHLKPVKWYVDNNLTDPSVVNALSNLQPLWATDNLTKGDKYE